MNKTVTKIKTPGTCMVRVDAKFAAYLDERAGRLRVSRVEVTRQIHSDLKKRGAKRA